MRSPEESEEPRPDAPSASAPGASAPGAPPPQAPSLSLRYTGVIAALLVVAAVGVGLGAGTVARRGPTPRPTPTVAVPTPTPAPTTDPLVFRQALSGACATAQAIWVVTNGGALLRYDGRDWSQVDGTLRTLTHASCDEGTLYAVGPVGAVLIVDDQARSVSSFDVTLADLSGVAAMPQGAMAVGTEGTVMLLFGGAWQPFARGIEEDLNALMVFGTQSAWAVGSQGISYRLEVAGWRPVKTGVDVALRAIAGPNIQTAVAVGDRGTIIALSGATWSRLDSGSDARLRAVAAVGSTAWAVGDRGAVLTVEGALVSPGVPPKPIAVQRVDIETTCTLTSVFARGQDVWIVGSTDGKGGVWRLRDRKVVEHWGDC